MATTPTTPTSGRDATPTSATPTTTTTRDARRLARALARATRSPHEVALADALARRWPRAEAEAALDALDRSTTGDEPATRDALVALVVALGDGLAAVADASDEAERASWSATTATWRDDPRAAEVEAEREARDAEVDARVAAGAAADDDDVALDPAAWWGAEVADLRAAGWSVALVAPDATGRADWWIATRGDLRVEAPTLASLARDAARLASPPSGGADDDPTTTTRVALDAATATAREAGVALDAALDARAHVDAWRHPDQAAEADARSDAAREAERVAIVAREAARDAHHAALAEGAVDLDALRATSDATPLARDLAIGLDRAAVALGGHALGDALAGAPLAWAWRSTPEGGAEVATTHHATPGEAGWSVATWATDDEAVAAWLVSTGRGALAGARALVAADAPEVADVARHAPERPTHHATRAALARALDATLAVGLVGDGVEVAWATMARDLALDPAEVERVAEVVADHRGDLDRVAGAVAVDAAEAAERAWRERHDDPDDDDPTGGDGSPTPDPTPWSPSLAAEAAARAEREARERGEAARADLDRDLATRPDLGRLGADPVDWWRVARALVAEREAPERDASAPSLAWLVGARDELIAERDEAEGEVDPTTLDQADRALAALDLALDGRAREGREVAPHVADAWARVAATLAADATLALARAPRAGEGDDDQAADSAASASGDGARADAHDARRRQADEAVALRDALRADLDALDHGAGDASDAARVALAHLDDALAPGAWATVGEVAWRVADAWAARHALAEAVASTRRDAAVEAAADLGRQAGDDRGRGALDHLDDDGERHVERLATASDDDDGPEVDAARDWWLDGSPDLSGEWADDPTPTSLARDLGLDPTSDDEAEVAAVDQAADAWLDAAADAWVGALDREVDARRAQREAEAAAAVEVAAMAGDPDALAEVAQLDREADALALGLDPVAALRVRAAEAAVEAVALGDDAAEVAAEVVVALVAADSADHHAGAWGDDPAALALRALGEARTLRGEPDHASVVVEASTFAPGDLAPDLARRATRALARGVVEVAHGAGVGVVDAVEAVVAATAEVVADERADARRGPHAPGWRGVGAWLGEGDLDLDLAPVDALALATLADPDAVDRAGVAVAEAVVAIADACRCAASEAVEGVVGEVAALVERRGGDLGVEVVATRPPLDAGERRERVARDLIALGDALAVGDHEGARDDALALALGDALVDLAAERAVDLAWLAERATTAAEAEVADAMGLDLARQRDRDEARDLGLDAHVARWLAERGLADLDPRGGATSS